MTSKRQSVKLEHIKNNGDSIVCTICNCKISASDFLFDRSVLGFITAHRHEDIKSLEKRK